MDLLVVSLFVLSSLNICSSESVTNLPGGITKCALEDDKCLLEGMNFVLKNFASTGLKELGLVQMDPLHIKKFSLGKNPNSPVNIDMTFNNAELIGLHDAHVMRVSPFSPNFTRPIRFEMVIPKITLKGPYTVEGKVLILPIVGKGNAEIYLENCKVSAVATLVSVVKGPHETYAKVTEVKLKLEPSRVFYKLGGLFNGQKELSENLHALINENWSDVFNELKPDISRAMGLIFKSLLNRTLGKLPLEQLFLDA